MYIFTVNKVCVCVCVCLYIYIYILGLHDIWKNYRSRDNSICDIRIAASCEKCNLVCQAFVCCMHRLSTFDQSDGACRLLSLYPPPSS